MIDKEYFKNYYKDHKEGYIKRYNKWRKDNPEKVRVINERHLRKKKATNKSRYSRVPLKELYIERYGKSLRKTKDDVTHTNHKRRIFCIDCINYKRGKTLNCPGWEKCKYRQEILEEIKK